METPEQRFNRLMQENNLSVSIQQGNIATTNLGGYVIESPRLTVTFIKDESIRAEAPTETTE